VCTPDGIIPTVDVTIDGVTSTSADTGQVLNTGGVDGGSCAHGSTPAGNESRQWTPIGGQACTGATVSLAPQTQTHTVGNVATATATFENGCGQPLQGASVAFDVASGPNAGATGSGVTDSNGQASFSYSGANAGTDTLQAAISNPAGTITSNTVDAVWSPSSPVIVSDTAPAGKYVACHALNFTVTFNEGVLVSSGGAPTAEIPLHLARGTKEALYNAAASNPSAGTLVFTYTVQPADSAPAPLTIGPSITLLNGSTITDPTGAANANLTLPQSVFPSVSIVRNQNDNCQGQNNNNQGQNH
jgi:hypothetical protein